MIHWNHFLYNTSELFFEFLCHSHDALNTEWVFGFLCHSHDTLITEWVFEFLCHSHDALNTELVFGFLCHNHDTLNTKWVFEFLLDRVRRATRTSCRSRSLRYSWASDSCSTTSSGVKRKQSKGDNPLHTRCTVLF